MEVLDAARNGRHSFVDHAQRGEQFFNRIVTTPAPSVETWSRGSSAPHLLEHRVGPLHPPVEGAGMAFGRRNGFAPQLAPPSGGPPQEFFVRMAARLEGAGDLFVSVRLQYWKARSSSSRALCPFPAGARWARRSLWFRAQCVAAAPGRPSIVQGPHVVNASASLTMMTRYPPPWPAAFCGRFPLAVFGREESSLVQLGAHRRSAPLLAELLAHLLHGDAGISTTSCSRPVCMATTSMRISARMRPRGRGAPM